MSETRRTPPTDVFDSQKTSLKNTLDDIHIGRIKLPEFQRGWVWPVENSVSLIESVAEGHPIGAAIFLETGGDVTFHSRCVEGSSDTAAANDNPAQLIMDGQQRLTTLYQMLRSTHPVVVKASKRPQYRLFYVDIAKALDTTYSIADAIIPVPTDAFGNSLRPGDVDYADPAVQYDRLVFPLNRTFQFRDWEGGFMTHWRGKDDIEEHHRAMRALSDFRDCFINSFNGANIPVILLRRGITIDGICRIYEKLNSRGVPLDEFDLVIARFAGEGFNIREDWLGSDADVKPSKRQAGRKERIVSTARGLLADLTPKLFFVGIQYLRGLEEGGTPLLSGDGILSVTVADYRKYSDRMVDGFISAARTMVREGAYTNGQLPPLYLMTAMAVLHAHLGARADDADATRRLLKWVWSVSYSGSYVSGPIRAIGVDLPEIATWVAEGGPDPKTVANAFIVSNKVRLAAPKHTLIFNAAMSGLVRMGARSLVNGGKINFGTFSDEKYEFAPVFSLKWCKANGISKERMESATNKTPMPRGLAKLALGRSPSEFVAILEKSPGMSPSLVDEILLSHGIVADHLRKEDFEAFFEARGQHLLSIVEADMGKAAISLEEVAAQPEEDEEEEAWPEKALYRLEARDALAYAYVDDGFLTILKGSIMSSDVNPSLHQTYVDARRRVLEQGLFETMQDGRWRLLQDLTMPSPSQAASVFAGRVAGPNLWKDRNGRTYEPRFFQEEAAAA